MACSKKIDMYMVCSILIYSTVCLILVNGFIPNHTGRWSEYTSTSQSHKQIMDTAVRQVAVQFMTDYPSIYPDHEAAMSTADFKTALKNFVKAVAKPDTEPAMSGLPEAHFDGEEILAANTRLLEERVKLLMALDGNEMSGARDVAGQLLHTLQDFYSHSNWLELGNTERNPALGSPGQEGDIGNMAGLDEPTCVNCDSDTCDDNIRNEILEDNILTSGYNKNSNNPNAEPEPEDKPVGKDKCSHGGMFDITRTVDARGGINKDTNAPEFSPRHFMHDDAAAMAVEATVSFLNGIRESRDDNVFAKFLGLAFGSSLCFVIDTTGSMSNEIAAVIETTIRITNEQTNSSSKPSDYVLVPFNDPDFGPAFVTEDPEAFKASLADLTASGGGDGPEMAFSGIRLALLAARAGSVCSVFTDAPAKDEHLMEEVSALAVEKRVQITIFRTDTFRKRSSRLNHHRQKRQSFDVYEELAAISGGQVIHTTKDNINDTLRIIDVGLSPIQVNIYQADYLSATSSVTPATFTVPVDETLTDVVFQVNTAGVISSVEVLDPSGALLVPGPPDSGSILISVTDIPSLKLYKVLAPAAGAWTIRVTCLTSYSLRVTAISLVDFTYQFVENVGGGHGGYRAIEGKPLGGVESTLLLAVFGGVSPMTGVPLPDGLAQISAVVLLAEDGTELQRISPAFMLDHLVEYEVSTILPGQGFRVLMEGMDSRGHKVQRLDTSVITTATSSVRVALGTDGSYTVTPGESVDVVIELTNRGAATTYTIAVTDSQAYFQHVIPDTLSLGVNETKPATATFAAPLDAALGQVSTVTISTSSAMDNNFIVFRLGTASKVADETPPVCAITDSAGNCRDTAVGSLPCQDDTWFISFTANDIGLGLYSVRPSEINSKAQFQVDPFTAGTLAVVNGNYTADCCYPQVTIVTSDALGNTGRCVIDHTPPPQPTYDDNASDIIIVNLNLIVISVFTGLLTWL